MFLSLLCFVVFVAATGRRLSRLQSALQAASHGIAHLGQNHQEADQDEAEYRCPVHGSDHQRSLFVEESRRVCFIVGSLVDWPAGWERSSAAPALRNPRETTRAQDIRRSLWGGSSLPLHFLLALWSATGTWVADALDDLESEVS